MANPNYVKFQRGSLASYERLSRKDENTLYFIYDSEDQTTGKLYLGTRLISANVGGSSTSLADLSDVLISEVGASNFLISNSDGKWIPISSKDVAQMIVAAGGNFITADEKEFTFNAVDGKLELKGYSNASNGMLPVKSSDGIIWQNAPIDLSSDVSNLNDRITILETNFSTIDGKIANAISHSAHLKYQVVNNLADAIEQNIIYLYKNDSGELNNGYDEFMIVNNQLEQIGTYGIDLDNYVTTLELNDAIANQTNNLTATFNSQIKGLSDKIDTLESSINNLDDIYVTQTVFNNTVGDLSELSKYNNFDYPSTSISETLEDIYERLTWQEIHE